VGQRGSDKISFHNFLNPKTKINNFPKNGINGQKNKNKTGILHEIAPPL
jgi:hypothetical protein